MQDIQTIKKQYQTAQNLETRVTLHAKHSTNKQGFGNWIFENYKFHNGCKILELGCGTGGMWKGHLNAIGSGDLLVLSDFSSGMLEKAKQNIGEHSNVVYKQIDIKNIPYNETEFDFVIANMMLYHVSNVQAAIKEVRRILKPGGVFYCATFGENGINHYFNDTLVEQGVNIKTKGTFTLQNGFEILNREFSSVQKLDYIDSFEITDINDLLDYLFSLSSIVDVKDLDRKSLFNIFQQKKDDIGIIHIPKEYGMFISKN
ncbi:class I SAM-dependent methyltransferase [Dethiothermospora halolimnae]|uniref:class I SAM-dependent methyltransferase n=1 Tax=Dethiothermospora halolimnae TaxID=3114390 RepID=UPI003CCB8CED